MMPVKVYRSRFAAILCAVCVTVWPFMFFKYGPDDQKSKDCLTHEMFHFRQQPRWLVLPWFAWYGLQYLWYRLVRGMGHWEAYGNIGFEKQAREYAKQRKKEQ
jgi:hypothetical protein